MCRCSVLHLVTHEAIDLVVLVARHVDAQLVRVRVGVGVGIRVRVRVMVRVEVGAKVRVRAKARDTARAGARG